MLNQGWFRGYFFFQQLHLDIKDRTSTENWIVDHLSRLEYFSYIHEGEQIREEFPNEQFMALYISQDPWYEDMVNEIVSGEYTPNIIT